MNIQHRETAAPRAGTVVGRILEIWRYPVQSLRGEPLRETLVDATGVPGDREYGVVDPEIGEFVSAAQGKRRWRPLVTLSARLLGDPSPGTRPPFEITAPGGETLRDGQPDVDARLSAIIGRPVQLVHRATGNKRSAYSHEPLHILTT
ncbi:MAG TPA: MOSC N-terminal beta barrel domain-containing protein, partial [Dongiaceae bacterium]